MTTDGMADHSSPRMLRDRAAVLIAVGNPVESVAGVFGMPVATMRALVGPAADERPLTSVPASLPPAWLHFPGTVIYRCPTYGAAALFIVLLIVTSATGFSKLDPQSGATPRQAWLRHARWLPLHALPAWRGRFSLRARCASTCTRTGSCTTRQQVAPSFPMRTSWR